MRRDEGLARPVERGTLAQSSHEGHICHGIFRCRAVIWKKDMVCPSRERAAQRAAEMLWCNYVDSPHPLPHPSPPHPTSDPLAWNASAASFQSVGCHVFSQGGGSEVIWKDLLCTHCAHCLCKPVISECVWGVGGSQVTAHHWWELQRFYSYRWWWRWWWGVFWTGHLCVLISANLNNWSHCGSKDFANICFCDLGISEFFWRGGTHLYMV